MPLATSPIDGAPMRQIRRYNIEFDLCPTSGGVWLDRGELEKLIAMAKEEARAEAASRDRRWGDEQDDDEEDDDYERRRRHAGGARRSRLSDIFDF